jgi:sugar transferase (PEP-CTERM/EpsH1 system associated)
MTRGVRPRVLYLCHRIPYPPNKGDKIRSYNTLRHLSARYDVTLAAFVDDAEDLVHRQALSEYARTIYLRPIDTRRVISAGLRAVRRREAVSLAYYHDPKMVSFIREARRSGFAAEIGFSSAVAPFLRGSPSPVLLDFADVDSAKWAAYAQAASGPKAVFYRREARLLARLEAGATRFADWTFLCSPEEAQVLRQVPGADGRRVDWFRNGVDLDYFRADAAFQRLGAATDVVFTGAMDYRPNVEAMTYFATNVWPMVRAQIPHARLTIVGARPARPVRDLDGRVGIRVTGSVPDVRPYLAAAKVVVAPLQIARGIQNKVLEAMAMEVPVVATTAALTGIGAVAGQHVVAADKPMEMAAAVAALINAPERSLELGRAGADFIRRNYRWSDALARLDAALPTPK